MYRISTITSLVLGSALLLAGVAAPAEVPRLASPESPLLSLPESPAWQQSRAFVAAYNAGSDEALARYLSTRLSPQAAAQQGVTDRAAALRLARAELGVIEVIEASGTSHALVLHARARDGRDVDIVVVVNANDPAQVDELLVIREGGSALAQWESL